MSNNLKKFFINGEWVQPNSQNLFDLINPSNEKSIGKITLGNKIDVELSIKSANQAFASFAFSTVEQRIHYLTQILQHMQENSEQLAEAMTAEMGAPYTFCREEQVASGIEHCQIMIETLKTFSFKEKIEHADVVLEPIGVCGLITPWNWPINQIACKVFPAIAAGCTMILKPSEIAPLSAMVFAEIIAKTDLPKGVFNLINGTGEEAGHLLSTSPGIQMMSITGSTRAGIAVAKASADTVKRVHQELGGNCPNIILPEADLENALDLGLRSVFSNSGQTCDSPARILIPATKIEQSKKIAKQAAESINIGDVNDPKTELGPLASEQHWQKVNALIALGKEQGELLVGGNEKPLPKGFYCQPTVILTDKNSEIAHLEIFGPVALIIPYQTIDEAIQIANDTEYGLAAYIQSGPNQAEKTKAYNLAKKLRCGTVQINYPNYSLKVPFGGHKSSGNGREYAKFGLHDFLEYKSIIQ